MSTSRVTKKLSTAIASGLYSGYLPTSPGTFGTIACIALWYGLFFLGLLGGVMVAVALAGGCIVVGLIVSTLCLRDLERSGKTDKDPQFIVIDEWAGMLIALIGISPLDWVQVGAAFALFRLFDIMKPGPVKWAERLPGAWGVMMDDIVAGVCASAVMQVI